MAKKKKKKLGGGGGRLKAGEPNDGKPEEALELASFEEGLHELEQIVADLEAGNLSLAESLDKYEKGIRNLKTCHQILEYAENRIRILTGVKRDGSAATESFEVQKTEIHQGANDAGIDELDGPDDDPGDDNVVDDSRTLF